MKIPIIIISYNNYKYVDNTINQLLKVNIDLQSDIRVLDNKSTCKETIQYLKLCKCDVIYSDKNDGPWINEYRNSNLYHSLPDKFILTDPDLEYNTSLPYNFVNVLVELSDKYNTEKVGLALCISDYDKMFNSIYTNNKTIYEHEIQFWEKKIDDIYELYEAAIDTTFCLVNKKGVNHKHIRIAGDFTAKHLPWYKHNNIYNIYENYELCSKMSNISTTSSKIIRYIDENFLKVQKNDIHFYIKKKDDPNFNFWKNIYSNWESDTFEVFDKFLDTSKVFIDIGAWVGTTCIYASRKSKHIYAVDADIESYKFLENNCNNNCNNYTIMNKAIYGVDNIDITFGKNQHLQDSKLNDSTSQICIDNIDNCYYIKTIRIQTLIETYNIKYNDISLIKVDIEGGEEFILNDLYDIYSTYNIPMFISFHYSWWKDTNLDRFSFLTEEQKRKIIREPFISLLFS